MNAMIRGPLLLAECFIPIIKIDLGFARHELAVGEKQIRAGTPGFAGEIGYAGAFRN